MIILKIMVMSKCKAPPPPPLLVNNLLVLKGKEKVKLFADFFHSNVNLLLLTQL